MKKIFIFLGLFIGFIGLYPYSNQKKALADKTTAAEREHVQAPQAGLAKKEEAQQQADEFDSGKRKKEVVNLVERGSNYFKKHSLDQACREFTHTKNFIKGELYLFVYDMQGNCFAHGNEAHFLWQNLYDLEDKFGTPIVRTIIKKAKDGGGWVTYNWRNAIKLSYVQRVVKDGKGYTIGAGYFPHSKKDAIVNLVKAGVRAFENFKEKGHPKEWAFARMTYPAGPFISGDLYLYAEDEKGISWVQGNLPGWVGSYLLDWQDEEGKYPDREIIKRLKKTDKGIWVDYVYKNTKKLTYNEKVYDLDGKSYFIGGGYYPYADRRTVIDLVGRGYQYMKGHGLSAAVEEFTDYYIGNKFFFGDLYLFILDMNGKSLAHGGNEDLVGTDLSIRQDADGRYYIKEIIQRAKEGGGWVTAKIKNSFQSTYVEKIDLGVDSYVIAADFFPISKHETMTLLVKSGVSYLKTQEREKAFAEFVKRDGNFVRGDLHLFVFDTKGICYVYGDDFDVIWRNLIGFKDDDGKPFVKIMIDTIAKHGPGLVRYKLNGAQKVSYVESLEKNGKTYLVGSGYYL